MRIIKGNLLENNLNCAEKCWISVEIIKNWGKSIYFGK
jgi:hypothetical protein